jgi:cytochrome c2
MSQMLSFPERAVWVMAAVALMLAAGVTAERIKNRVESDNVAALLSKGDSSRAPELFRRYGCAGCHQIPGIPGADGKVGGPLTDLRERVYIAGVANNTSETLVQWIVSPSAFDTKTAMPDTGISEAEARDLVAYLYAQ